MGASPPWTPHFPSLVGLRFANALGPTRGGIANAGNLPPLLVFGGTSPRPPAMGSSPPRTPVLPTLGGLGFASVLGVNLSLAPLRGGEGRTPPNFPPSLAGKGVRSEGGHPRPPSLKYYTSTLESSAMPLDGGAVCWGRARLMGVNFGYRGAPALGCRLPLVFFKQVETNGVKHAGCGDGKYEAQEAHGFYANQYA